MIRPCIILAALFLASSAHAQTPTADQLQARLGIGDLRGLSKLQGAAGLPVLYELLARADEGDFRQYSGGIRGVLISRIIGTDGHATYLAQRIEAATASGDDARRAEAFNALGAVASPEAAKLLQAYLTDHRGERGTGAPGSSLPNSFLAARSLSRLLGLRSPVAGGTGPFSVEDAVKVQAWAGTALGSAFAPNPRVETDRPSFTNARERGRPPTPATTARRGVPEIEYSLATPVASSRDDQVAWWSGSAGILGGMAITLLVKGRRRVRA